MIKLYLWFSIILLSFSINAGQELSGAVKKGDTAKAVQLLEKGSDANFIDPKTNRSLLFEAVDSNNFDMVKLLLEKGADPNGIAYEKYSILAAAAAKAKPEIVKLLVEKGAAPDSQSGVVSMSVERGNTELVEWLLNRGGDINEDFSPYGLSPLNVAIAKGDLKFVQLLVGKGADVNHVHKLANKTPLMVAASSGQGKILKFLLDRGADASFRNTNGQTAIDYAKADNIRMIFILNDKKTGPFFKTVLGRDVQEIKKKLNEGFNADTTDLMGATALMYCSFMGNLEGVKLLLSNNADVNIQDRRGTSALSAAARAKNKEIVRLLLDAGANPNPVIDDVRDKADSPLVAAVRANDFVIVEELVKAGADINESANEYRKTIPVLIACRFASAEIADFLIENGARLNVVDNIGCTPLISAAAAGKIETVKLLWQKYKQPMVSERWTALGIAAANGKLELIKFLIENDADVNMISTEYRISPLMASVTDPEITEYLVKHGANLEHEGGILNSTALSLAVREDQTFLSSKQLKESRLSQDVIESQSKKHAQSHSRQLAVIEILLNAGADQNHKDKSGKSPRDYANNSDVKALLDKYNKK